MANPEHLAILKQGVEAWNEWRKKNTKTIPDLRGVDLGRMDFSNILLYETDLRGANLSNAEFWEADLHASNFSNAQLEKARFVAANLNATALFNTNLRGAMFFDSRLVATNLEGATLIEADFSWAKLQGAYLLTADLSQAIVAWTIFANLDLSRTKGLETVRHRGPSVIGIDTVYRSGGNIPEVFLRNCGVPDTFIEFSRSLVGRPIQFYSCFISYSSKDESFAKQLHADIRSKGIRVWFAPEDLKIGDKFRTRIDEAIRIYDKLLIVLSGNSISSQWVEKEVEAAFEKERQQNRTVLFPIRLDDAVMKTNQSWAADIRRTRHIGDFSSWKDHDSYQAAFERLLRDLTAVEKAPGE